MSITQNVEFPASTGATLTANLFAVGSDTVAQAAATVTEATNRKGLYVAQFTTLTGVPAGIYQINAQDAGGNPFYMGSVELALANGTYEVFDLGDVGIGTNDKATTIITQTNATNLAAGVLDAAASAHNTSGTIGAKINTAGSAADPLNNAVPGNYASGTAGNILGHLAGTSITIVSPVGVTGAISIVRGRDYRSADGQAVSLVNAAGTWPNLTSASAITLYVRTIGTDATVLTLTGSSPVPTGPNQSVSFDVTAANTASLTATKYTYEIAATLSNGHVVNLASGSFTLLANGSS